MNEREALKVIVQKRHWIKKNPCMSKNKDCDNCKDEACPIYIATQALAPQEQWSEIIKCPMCGLQQKAIVKNSTPFPIYIHDCKQCGYTITESEWEEVKPQECDVNIQITDEEIETNTICGVKYPHICSVHYAVDKGILSLIDGDNAESDEIVLNRLYKLNALATNMGQRMEDKLKEYKQLHSQEKTFTVKEVKEITRLQQEKTIKEMMDLFKKTFAEFEKEVK